MEYNRKKPISPLQKKLIIDLVNALMEVDKTVKSIKIDVVDNLTCGKAHFVIQSLYDKLRLKTNTISSVELWKIIVETKDGDDGAEIITTW